MRLPKKILLASLFCIAFTSLACWFTNDNFNSDYIAGANNYVAHYTPVLNINDVVYYNGMDIALPITLFVKVSPLYNDGTLRNIQRAVLQYRIGTSGSWVTVKTVTRLSDLDFSQPVALFGKNIIDIPSSQISANTYIYIRVYLTDGVYETGDLNADITNTVADQITDGSLNLGGGWTPAFVFKVKYNGKRRPKN